MIRIHGEVHWLSLGDIHMSKLSAAEWLNQLPKKYWVQYFDEAKHWGHMTTNLSESVNTMFKSTRYLPMSLFVEKTYFKITKLFVIRG